MAGMDAGLRVRLGQLRLSLGDDEHRQLRVGAPVDEVVGGAAGTETRYSAIALCAMILVGERSTSSSPCTLLRAPYAPA